MTAREAMWEIPEPAATRHAVMGDGAKIALRRHGNTDGPRLVLTHGNGLAIDLYYPFWSLLADDYDLVVYDLRHHGWNEVNPLETHNMPTFVDDHDRIMEAIDQHFGDKPKIGVFHSISALISLLSPTRGSGFVGRFLFDPPLCKPGKSYQQMEEAANHTATLTRRRAERFSTREDFSFLLGFVPLFSRVVPGVLDLMARTTLRASEGRQGYELRCPKEYEARIVEYAGVFSVMVDFDTLASPTKVMGADPTLPFSYLPTLDLSDILTVDYDFLPEATHFLQLEEPEECAAALREFVDDILEG
ncbi:MAG: alpha/beta hydrolase [Acidimicrobiia bacterium]|nr:alpha/beta hydrolase [Acidimicrobiia bacterium]MYH05093.1 alpha/beta hydrolase [Acidimicrobiia bacterium]MYK55057.1 alpha/beta hydrolase [Acidimicrobiia bacterium]